VCAKATQDRGYLKRVLEPKCCHDYCAPAALVWYDHAVCWSTVISHYGSPVLSSPPRFVVLGGCLVTPLCSQFERPRVEREVYLLSDLLADRYFDQQVRKFLCYLLGSPFPFNRCGNQHTVPLVDGCFRDG